ncbi:Diuretic hormone receptor, partial [Eumeta japonica]
GFTVALFYCFMNTEVRHAICYHVERWKTGRAIGGGRKRGASYSKDWSPRSRTESIRIVIEEDKIRVHHYDAKSKRESMQWFIRELAHPKIFNHFSAGTVVVTIIVILKEYF